MIGYHKESLCKLLDQIKLASRDPFSNTKLWSSIQLIILKKIISLENKIREINDEIKNLNIKRKNPIARICNPCPHNIFSYICLEASGVFLKYDVGSNFKTLNNLFLMDIKKIFVFLFTFFSIVTYSQKKTKELYQILIFKSDEKDLKNRDFVKIDSLGNIFSFNKETGEQIKLKSFNKALSKFVEQESGIEKVPASNDYRPLSIIPGSGQYSFEIKITFLEDYHNEKDFKVKTVYKWSSVSDVNQKQVFIKYLSKEDKLIIDKFLD